MKKLIPLSIIIALTIGFVSCAPANESDIIVKDETTTITDITEEIITARAELEVPDVNYNGYEFRVLSVNSTTMGNSTQTGSHFWSDFGYNEERAGEPINDAVYKRNLAAEEKFGIKITMNETADVKATAEKLIAAGDDMYDIIMPIIDKTFSMAQGGYITNLYDIPYLDLSKPWWDIVLVEALSMGNRIYVSTGDISMEDEEYNWVIIFNKSMVETFNLGNPYQAVRDGIWNYDLFYKMGREVTLDINGDGVLDRHDSYGYGNDYTGGMYTSSGVKIAELDVDGRPQITIDSPRSVAVIDRTIELFNDRNFMLWVSEMTGVDNGWNELNNMLMDDRLLFRSGNIYNIKQYRDMTGDFGLLPGPKYNDQQEQYYMAVSSHACSGICVPATNSDLERTGIILETLAYMSDTVQNAYYDVTLAGKFARDAESLEMLEIIFSSRSYDIGKIFGWGKITDIISSATQTNASFIVKYEAVASAAHAEMENSYNTFMEDIK